jgi:ADP-ribose pyrophosphatase YjhB (NUDIX family)
MMRASVVVVEQARVALIEQRYAGDPGYSFPGGMPEPDEAPEVAAARTAYAALGLRVRLQRLVAVLSEGGEEQLFFLANIDAGYARADLRREGDSTPAGGAVWLPVQGLTRLPVYPRELALLVEYSANGWPREPLRLTQRRREAGLVPA